MIFPSVRSSITGGTGSAATDHTVTLPADIQANDLIFPMGCAAQPVAAIDWDSAAAIGIWTPIFEETASGAINTITTAIIADGSEDSATLNVNLDATSGFRWIIYVIQDWFGDIATGIDFARVAVGTPDDPPSLNPSSWAAEAAMWIALLQGDNNSGVSVWPTNYDDNQLATSGGATSHVVASSRELNAESEDPGAYTMSNTRTRLVATIAIRPAADAGATFMPAMSDSMMVRT